MKEEIIENLRKKLVKKEIELERLKNSKLKIALIVVFCCFTFPYLPMKHGSALIYKYGYWGAVLFGVIVFSLVIPFAFLRVIDKYDNEIAELNAEIRNCENKQD